MKLVLIGSLLLVHTVYSESPLEIQRTTQSPLEIQRAKCFEFMNYGRADYATKYGIANMNELVYNISLETKIREELEHTKGCPNASIVTKDSLVFWLAENPNLYKGLKLKMMAETGSTMMACVKTKCGNGIAIDASMSPTLPGLPGSQCPAGRMANYDKLCALKGSRRGKYQRKCEFFGCIGRSIDKIFG